MPFFDRLGGISPEGDHPWFFFPEDRSRVTAGSEVELVLMRGPEKDPLMGTSGTARETRRSRTRTKDGLRDP